MDLPLLAVLGGAALLLVLAYRTAIPYPILLVARRARRSVHPRAARRGARAGRWCSLIFLPPLLYAAAFFSSLRELRDNVRPISLLAVGLVLATTLGVAVGRARRGRGLSWEAAFVARRDRLPTDPVAATAIAARWARRGGWSRPRGRGLINDATALVAYRVAVAAVVDGHVLAARRRRRFVAQRGGGVAIGLAVGASSPRSGGGSTTRRPRSRSPAHAVLRLPAGGGARRRRA